MRLDVPAAVMVTAMMLSPLNSGRLKRENDLFLIAPGLRKLLVEARSQG